MGKEYRIRVTGKPKKRIDVDLLAEAVVAIAEQQLLLEQEAKSRRPNSAATSRQDEPPRHQESA